MGQIELNDGLAQHMRQTGDPPLNPEGRQGSPELRSSRRQFRDALLHALDEPCDLPGFEGMTWGEAGRRTLLIAYVAGEQWAVKEVHNRAYGRVPLAVDASVNVAMPLADLSTEELIERAERLTSIAREMAAPMLTEAVEGTVVDADSGGDSVSSRSARTYDSEA
jgi:hypothetical protein